MVTGYFCKSFWNQRKLKTTPRKRTHTNIHTYTHLPLEKRKYRTIAEIARHHVFRHSFKI